MSYITIYKREEYEMEIKKSRFIGYAFPVSKEEEALDFIDEIKKLHPASRHCCFAYVIGEKKNTQRYSDDGEPSGTAGIPILELIKKKDLTDIVVVVVRYFGGILLGAGGLVRAYSGTANETINKGTIVEKMEFSSLDIIIDYNNYGRILNFLEENNYFITDKIFEENVVIKVFISVDILEKFQQNILDLTSGNVEIYENERMLLNTKNNRIYIEE